MRKKILAFLCAAAATVEAVGTGSYAAVLSYAEENEASVEISAPEIPESEEIFDEADADETVTSDAGCDYDAPVSSDDAYDADETVSIENDFAEKNGFTGEIAVTGKNESFEIAVKNGWEKDSDGRFYYYRNSMNAVTGVQNIDGQDYLFGNNGVLKTGWRTVNGKRYYFNPTTGKAEYGLVEYAGNEYFVDSAEGKKTGFIKNDDGTTSLFDENGARYSGNKFFNFKGNIYFADNNGILAAGTKTIEGVPYLFGEDCILKTGWRTVDGKRYYYDTKTGERKLGFITYNGSKYYISAEKGKATGSFSIDGVNYYFSTEGVLLTGWQTINGQKHYYYENGQPAVGMQTIDGGTYFFSKTGILMTGWQNIDGSPMYFSADGTLKKGWQDIDGNKYYFMSTGKAVVGLCKIGGKIYYFAKDGKALKNDWHTSEKGNKYYFGSDCVAVSGLTEIAGNSYYFNSDCELQKGWQTIGENTYYFDLTTGAMAKNTTVDGIVIGADGVAVKESPVEKRANEILKVSGKTIDGIYNYVRNNNKYKYIEPTRSLNEIETVGWSYFANYAMDNRFVVCYYFAAITDVLLKQAGYETRIVYGTGRGEGEHYWNQVKVNGVWTNYDTCNGYANVTDSYLKSINYTWYQYVKAVYR